MENAFLTASKLNRIIENYKYYSDQYSQIRQFQLIQGFDFEIFPIWRAYLPV